MRLNGDEDEDALHTLKITQRFNFLGWFLPFLIILSIFLPTRNTLIAMIVAQNITSNNVSKALQVGKDFKGELKKDVIDIINSIQSDKSKNK